MKIIKCQVCGKVLKEEVDSYPLQIFFVTCGDCFSWISKNITPKAQQFRHEKMKEIMNKENPTKEEIGFIESWAEMFQEEL